MGKGSGFGMGGPFAPHGARPPVRDVSVIKADQAANRRIRVLLEAYPEHGDYRVELARRGLSLPEVRMMLEEACAKSRDAARTKAAARRNLNDLADDIPSYSR